MEKFPSIEQFRSAIRNVRHKARFRGRDPETDEPIFDHSIRYPVVEYRGTVKLHGTNAGIVYDFLHDEFTYQSRERELSLTQDNAGFMFYMKHREDLLRDIFIDLDNYFYGHTPPGRHITKFALFGEWCGLGIQKGVAISEIPKTWVIFALKAIFDDGSATWIDISEQELVSILQANWTHRIYNIYQFPTFQVNIDFEQPEFAQQQMVEITEQVEKECPVGKHFGISGVGEDVVWSPVDPMWRSSDHWFKVKGEKHSTSKVKTLAAVDVETVKKVNDFVEYAVTENRLEQGLNWLLNEAKKPFEMTSIGDFIRWVFNDVVKEETDTIVANQLDPKKLGGPIANKSKNWYISKLNSSDIAA